MIKLAMMTSAYTRDCDERSLLYEMNSLEATLWGMGARHVDPQKALDQCWFGVYLIVDYYMDFLCVSNYSAKRFITHKVVECEKRTMIA